jgi:integration host factor subunit beta
MESMTKAELVKEVAQAADLTKKHSEVIVNVVFQSIINALQEDEKVELRGFGSFRIRQRRSRQGRNPKTGDKVQVPPKKIPYFKPGKELKQFINDADIPLGPPSDDDWDDDEYVDAGEDEARPARSTRARGGSRGGRDAQ